MISIVIPAFNEAERLPPTLRNLVAWLGANAADYEIVVSDDGSTDGTAQVAAEHARVVGGLPNRGKGHAVRVGMLAAHGDIRVMCDADGSMAPAELPKLLGPIERGEVAVAIGSRYLDGGHSRGQSALRRAWSRGAHAMTERLVPGVRDLHCGYKAFSAKAANDVFAHATLDRWGFDLEILALARRGGHAMREVAIEWHDDGRSRVRARDFPQTALEVARLFWRFRR